MNKVHILDCTLRDGGYCNQWQFGFENIKKIVSGLEEANIEIIECGFLTLNTEMNSDVTKFLSLESVSRVLPRVRNKMFVVMINYGEYRIENIPDYDGTNVNGIRVAFHKKNMKEALEFCEKIKEKGYKVFIQPMVAFSYKDEEFLELINKVNKIEPYAFYIVDSFGSMKKKEMIRLYYLVENNLKENIWIGFHSHNNMQLAYSNAQELVNMHTHRDLIIDSSIYGMGRGAGNLNTELFVEYLNEHIGKRYLRRPLLTIIDDILNDFYQRNYWGYSLPNYLSAVHNAHPNYAGYLDNKKTLTVEAMNKIFDMMEIEKKVIYDQQYIEQIYHQYMTNGDYNGKYEAELKNFLKEKEVLLIAPGKSSTVEKEKIVKFIKNKNIITIGVNFNYSYIETDFIFLSNLKRYRELKQDKKRKYIVTSNILSSNACFQVKYDNLLNSEIAVKDNAGLMAIKFLIDAGVKEIYLAGFDGYSYDVHQNYGKEKMAYITKEEVLDKINEGMENTLKEFSKYVKISFLTTSKYILYK